MCARAAYTYIHISTTNHNEAAGKMRTPRDSIETIEKKEAKIENYDIRMSSYFNEHVTLSLGTFIVHTYLFIYLFNIFSSLCLACAWRIFNRHL